LPEVVPVSVVDLRKSYTGSGGFRRFAALRGISFDLLQGEILGFLGPNGAGKTTTIKCILGLLSPGSGSVRVLGRRPGSAEARKHLGYVPENPDYDDSFTPLEYIRLFAGMRGFDRSPETASALLSRVGLQGWGNTRMRKLSKGMKQRLSLALALQGSPDILVLDEPTGGLDPGARKEFRDIILQEKDRGASIFFSSHILSEVEMVCSRALILSAGSLVRAGTLDELLRTEHTWRIRYASDSVEHEEAVQLDSLQERIDSLRRGGASILEVSRQFRSLEEVFLSATVGER
jgi:ABC-2 type transport system ATP-binding protein